MYGRCLGLAAGIAMWTLLARAEVPSTDLTGLTGPAAPELPAAPVVSAVPAPQALPVRPVPSAMPVTPVMPLTHVMPVTPVMPVTSAASAASAASALAIKHAEPAASLTTVRPMMAAASATSVILPTAEAGTPPVALLPIPTPPPQPALPTKFAARADDLAGQAARTIARRVAHFRSYRSEVPGATWRVDEAAVFRIRADAQCKRALEQARVPAHLVERELSTPVPSPVALEGPVAGVTFHSLHTDRVVEMACELAVRLPAIAAILKRHGVRAVGVLSSYREGPRMSFHTFGLALDLASFETKRGLLVVTDHFEPTPGQLTCDSTPSTEEGKVLLAIACDLAASNLASSVLTPNYNAGHADHFHLDIRPDDPRVFLR